MSVYNGLDMYIGENDSEIDDENDGYSNEDVVRQHSDSKAVNETDRVVHKTKKASKKKKMSELFRQIDKDANDIDDLLARSRSLVEENNQKQYLAMMSFQEEVRAIGDLSSIEEYFAISQNSSRPIDHNINRMIRSTNTSTLKPLSAYKTLDEVGLTENNEISGENLDNRPLSSVRKHISGNGGNKHDTEPISFEDKGSIRVKIMELLEKTREKEDILNDELTSARKSNPHQSVIVADQLYQLQKQNLDKLNQFISDYRLTNSTKPWSHDPDHLIFSQRLRQALDGCADSSI